MSIKRFANWTSIQSRDFFRHSEKFFNLKILSILTTINIIFLIAHSILGILLEKIPPILNISYDRSMPEWFSYGMLATSSIVLLQAFFRERSPLLISFSAILLLMLVDDSMEIHERAGAIISTSMEYVSIAGLDPKDTGEMLAYGLMVLIIMPLVIYGVARTPLSEWRRYYILSILVGLLGFFAVGIDLIHEPICREVARSWRCFQIVDLLEDGGEMVWEAFIVAHVFAVFRSSEFRQTNG